MEGSEAPVLATVVARASGPQPIYLLGARWSVENPWCIQGARMSGGFGCAFTVCAGARATVLLAHAYRWCRFSSARLPRIAHGMSQSRAQMSGRMLPVNTQGHVWACAACSRQRLLRTRASG
eukprot:15257237-Alexandrium_andersonii.AAC.1